MKHSQEVFESHMKAVSTLNPVNVAQDYADDVLFITPDHTYKGKEEILNFYEEFFAKLQGFCI